MILLLLIFSLKYVKWYFIFGRVPWGSISDDDKYFLHFQYQVVKDFIIIIFLFATCKMFYFIFGRVPWGSISDDDEMYGSAKRAGEQRIHHSHETSQENWYLGNKDDI